MTYITYILLGFLWWQVVATVGVSAGYHRYWSHKSFTAPVWFEWVSLYLALLSGARGPLGWVGSHRMHHRYYDTDKDPHSPFYQGWWRVFTSTWKVDKIEKRYIVDLIKNPRIQFFHKYWKVIWSGTGIVLALIGIEYFFIFWLSPLFWGYLGFGLLNTQGHADGPTTTNILTNIITAGEGNHELHHKNSKAYKITSGWDPSAWFITLIKT